MADYDNNNDDDDGDGQMQETSFIGGSDDEDDEEQQHGTQDSSDSSAMMAGYSEDEKEDDDDENNDDDDDDDDDNGNGNGQGGGEPPANDDSSDSSTMMVAPVEAEDEGNDHAEDFSVDMIMDALHQECMNPNGVFGQVGPEIWRRATEDRFTARIHKRRGEWIFHVSPFGIQDLRAVELDQNGRPREYGPQEVRNLINSPIIAHRRGALQPCKFLYDIWSHHDLANTLRTVQPKRSAEFWAAVNLRRALAISMNTKRIALSSAPTEHAVIRDWLQDSIDNDEYDDDGLSAFVEALLQPQQQPAEPQQQQQQLVGRLQRLNLCRRSDPFHRLETKELYIYIFAKETSPETHICATEGDGANTVGQEQAERPNSNLEFQSMHYMSIDPFFGVNNKFFDCGTWVQPSGFIRVWVDDNGNIRFDPLKRNGFLRHNRDTQVPSASHAAANEVIITQNNQLPL